MTTEEAAANQKRIAERYNLGWWYALNAEKCCGVFPKVMTANTLDVKDCYLQCEVCRKRTKLYTMPWLAVEAWNKHEYKDEWTQQTLF